MNKKALSAEVISQWPEVLRDVEITAVPLEYLESLQIIFIEGNTWDIDIATHVRENNIDDLEQHLNELIAEYDDVIEHVEFQLNIKKVKRDITKKTTAFLKKQNKKR